MQTQTSIETVERSNPLIEGVNQLLDTVIIKGTPVIIKVISDDQPEMELAYRLWYEVFVEELKRTEYEGICHFEKKLKVEPNGSWMFLALTDGKCIGTQRATLSSQVSPEFNYEQYLGKAIFYELSKFAIQKEFRKTNLSAHLINEPYHYCKSNWLIRKFDYVVMNSRLSMIPFYSVFGFKKLHQNSMLHPILNIPIYLMACDTVQSENNVRTLSNVIRNNPFTKASVAIKYWWYKQWLRSETI